MTLLYKILTEDAWVKAKNEGCFEGSLIDLRDGFIHLSARDQVAETLKLHFHGQENLNLVAFPESALTSLVWEPSRGGQLFPHVYTSIDPLLAVQEWSLILGPTGTPLPPWSVEDEETLR